MLKVWRFYCLLFSGKTSQLFCEAMGVLSALWLDGQIWFSRFANHCNIVHYNMVQGTWWHHEKRTQPSSLFLFCRARPSVFGMGEKRLLPNKKKRRPFVLLFCTPSGTSIYCVWWRCVRYFCFQLTTISHIFVYCVDINPSVPTFRL